MLLCRWCAVPKSLLIKDWHANCHICAIYNPSHVGMGGEQGCGMPLITLISFLPAGWPGRGEVHTECFLCWRISSEVWAVRMWFPEESGAFCLPHSKNALAHTLSPPTRFFFPANGGWIWPRLVVFYPTPDSLETLYSETLKESIAQSQHCWHLLPAKSLLWWWEVLCIVGCLVKFLVSTYQMAAVSPQSWQSDMKMSPVLGGVNGPGLGTTPLIVLVTRDARVLHGKSHVTFQRTETCWHDQWQPSQWLRRNIRCFSMLVIELPRRPKSWT